jgi:hypothetical protein
MGARAKEEKRRKEVVGRCVSIRREGREEQRERGRQGPAAKCNFNNNPFCGWPTTSSSRTKAKEDATVWKRMGERERERVREERRKRTPRDRKCR